VFAFICIFLFLVLLLFHFLCSFEARPGKSLDLFSLCGHLTFDVCRLTFGHPQLVTALRPSFVLSTSTLLRAKAKRAKFRTIHREPENRNPTSFFSVQSNSIQHINNREIFSLVPQTKPLRLGSHERLCDSATLPDSPSCFPRSRSASDFPISLGRLPSAHYPLFALKSKVQESLRLHSIAPVG